MIAVGQKLPAVRLKHLTEGGLADIDTATLFDRGTSIIFGIPGCFTPTCTQQHGPSFVCNSEPFKQAGVDRIACLAVNDPFVMHEWLKLIGGEKDIIGLPDGNATFTKALGLDIDGTAFNLGTRCKRFAMVVKDGVVTDLTIDAPGAYEVTSAEAVLKRLAA